MFVMTWCAKSPHVYAPNTVTPSRPTTVSFCAAFNILFNISFVYTAQRGEVDIIDGVVSHLALGRRPRQKGSVPYVLVCVSRLWFALVFLSSSY